ncbi:MAG: nitroreductase family protein [Kofleriaceae bacterium]
MTPGDLHGVLAARASVRAFAPQPLDDARLMGLFATAQRAASWCNIQPWRVVVTTGAATARVRGALVTAARSGLPSPELPFPLAYPEPYDGHRRACAGALYGAMGIGRTDKAARYDAWLRNFELFDAPHLAVVSVDRRLGPYALVDVGVWLGTLLAAAAVDDVATCPMASVASYPAALRAELPIAPEQQILFGVVLGHAADAPANACRTGRADVTTNVTLVTQ